MGQKTNPIGNRLGYIQGWESNWFGGSNYGDKIVEDDKIRRYLKARLAKASIAKVIIERTLKLVTVTINTARPGVIIGKGGQEVDKLKEELKKLTKKEIQINIFEVKRPEFVKVKYLDIKGNSKEKVFNGFEAVCVQHEIDHLAGTLFTSYISRLKRQIIIKKMQKLKKILNKAI